jgi:hypothetical protein
MKDSPETKIQLRSKPQGKCKALVNYNKIVSNRMERNHRVSGICRERGVYGGVFGAPRQKHPHICQVSRQFPKNQITNQETKRVILNTARRKKGAVPKVIGTASKNLI